jgi:hypothetical protein
MTYSQRLDTMVSKMQKYTTEMLVEVVKGIADDLTDAAALVEAAALEILIERMPEQDFVNLCDSL